MTTTSPLKRFVLPFPETGRTAEGNPMEFKDPLKFLKAWGYASGDGLFPLGINGQWHGGIHFDAGTGTAGFDQESGIRCIADGEVVAYRIDEEYPVLEFKDMVPEPDGKAHYSSGFVLVRHCLEMPPELLPAAQASNPPSCIFYSLYMHIKHWKDYEDESTDNPLRRPKFWGIEPANKRLVSIKAKDKYPNWNIPGMTEEEKGKLGILLKVKEGNTYREIGWVVRGSRITVKDGADDMRQFVSIEKGTVRYIPDCTQEDKSRAVVKYMELDEIITDPERNKVKIVTPAVEIKAGELIGHLGQFVRYSPEVINRTDNRPLLHLEVFADKAAFDTFIAQCREADKNSTTGKYILTISKGAKLVEEKEATVELKAGEGLMKAPDSPRNKNWLKAVRGTFEEINRPTDYATTDKTQKYSGGKLLYEAIKPNPNGKTLVANKFLRETTTTRNTFTKRTVFIPSQETVWVSRNDLTGTMDLEAAGTNNSHHIVKLIRDKKGWDGFPLEVGKTEIDAAEASNIINTRTSYEIKDRTRDDAKNRWWKVSVLSKPDANNANNRERDGWACEANHPLVEVTTPWAWPGFEIQKEDTTKPVEWCEKQLDKELMADNALLKQLFDIIDLNNDGKLELEEIRKAWDVPQLVRPLSRQIIPHDNEWGIPMAEWDKIDCKLTEDNEKKIWAKEKERYSKLRFWDDTSSIASFPASYNVYHLHPLGVIENFTKTNDLICKECGEVITLTEEFLIKIMPRAKKVFIDELILCSTELFPKYGVNTCRQIKHILAQAKQETTHFTKFREDLHYVSGGAQRVYELSPTVINNGFTRKGLTFATTQAKLNWIQTHIIGNDAAYGEHCYGTNEQPGKDFRGRGLLHLTHYDTYKKCAQEIGYPINSQPELVENNPRVIIETGLWFWKKNNIANIANNSENDGNEGVKKVTHPINSGYDGLANRQTYKREISANFDEEFFSGCQG